MQVWRELLATMSPPRIVNIAGGGGKTSLLYLLQELCFAEGWAAVASGTTKFSACPAPWKEYCRIDSAAELIAAARRNEERAIIGSFLSEDKVKGLEPHWIAEAAAAEPECFFLVECDGSAGLSLKGHLAHEPVPVPTGSLLIVVLGLDALGAELKGKNAHRPERIAELSGLAVGESITMQAVCNLLLHPQGVLRSCRAGCRAVVYLNKNDLPEAKDKASALAKMLRRQSCGRIDAVISGSLRCRDFHKEW